MHVTRAASDANAAQQRRFADRIDASVGGVHGRTLAILGLAFKGGTDDVRDSPALAVARDLLSRGAHVRGFDPAASANAARELPDLQIAASAELALDGADGAIIATDWPVFRSIDWAAARDRLRSPLVIDGRRLLDPDAMRALGYTYVVVGTQRPADGARDEREPLPAGVDVSVGGALDDGPTSPPGR